MSEKPTYLGLLNAVAVGEQRGGEILSAWAAATPDPELAKTLSVVAIREREHAASFAKRLCELGFDVRTKPSAAFEAHLNLAASSASDAEKFAEVLPVAKSDRNSDPLNHLFDDPSIDPQTGALLGRFIAEERDSERLLSAARARVTSSEESDGELEEIKARIERLTETLEDLKAMRS
ncbi:MAG: hypothetical protein NXH85_07540 [Pseudomonadaceae bacterium]|nr:hypothetical protein [Pseudomonadaceae bacterium]